MSASSPQHSDWPATIIHVNEDGWVLVNRGQQQGVSVGLRLLVVGEGVRELRDVSLPEESLADATPVLRTRRTYELLEVVYITEKVAVAIATRTPAERRPSFYQGSEGELLVWVPLASTYTSPLSSSSAENADTAADTENTSDWDENTSDGEENVPEDTTDEPPSTSVQDDELWDQSLPLNGVHVGDLVVPALPATSPSTGGDPKATASAGGSTTSAPFEQGRTYDWMKSGQ